MDKVCSSQKVPAALKVAHSLKFEIQYSLFAANEHSCSLLMNKNKTLVVEKRDALILSPLRYPESASDDELLDPRPVFVL